MDQRASTGGLFSLRKKELTKEGRKMEWVKTRRNYKLKEREADSE